MMKRIAKVINCPCCLKQNKVNILANEKVLEGATIECSRCFIFIDINKNINNIIDNNVDNERLLIYA